MRVEYDEGSCYFRRVKGEDSGEEFSKAEVVGYLEPDRAEAIAEEYRIRMAQHRASQRRAIRRRVERVRHMDGARAPFTLGAIAKLSKL